MSALADVHIERWGESGERVIFVHGGAQGTQSAGYKNFWAQEELGAQGWHLILPDRRAAGDRPSRSWR